MKRFWPSCVACLFCLISAGGALAQTLTYHLHKEASTTGGLDQLKSGGPDATTFALLSANLAGQNNGEYLIEAFNTQASDPSMSGSIPSNSTVSFSLYMRKTANVGTMTPRAKLFLNSSSGTQFCTATGTTALTTTVTKISLSCKTSSAITIASTDRLYLWVGVNLTAGSTSPFNGELDVEGTLNGSTDSQVTAPAPAAVISSLTPNTGAVQASVTIAGQNFGLTPGTVTFSSNKGATIPSQDWTPTQILVPMVPTGAMTGSVTVTASGKAVTGLTFTVVPAPSISSLSPASGPIGTQVTISGSNFGTTAGTVKFSGIQAAATWGASSITATVPAGATTGNVVVHASGVDSNAKTFTVTAGGFSTTGNVRVFHSNFTATLLNSGKVLLAGGEGPSGGNALTDGELYDPTAGTFSATGSLNGARYDHTATLLDAGTVLIAGGTILDSHGNLVPQASAELYSAATGTFTTTGSLNTARYSHTATLLSNGLVLIAGGSTLNGASAMTSAELYNPATGTFTATGSLNTARYSHTATLLNNGMVLIAGGFGGSSPVSSAELYNPATGTFTSTGNLNAARTAHTATLLNTGAVLLAGGYSGSATLASAELYNPASGSFSTTGNLNNSRDSHTATLLNNGTVLVAGGFSTSSSTDLAAAEVYDPVAGTFTLTGSLNDGRCCGAATLLNNGNVLVAGGFDNSGLTNTAELYQPSVLTPPGLVSIAITPSNPSVVVRGSQGLIATGTFSDNSTQNLASVTWSSSNTAVTSVSNDSSNRGQALGVATGSSTVSACAGSTCGSTTVSVVQLAITSVSPTSGPAGASVTITGTGFLSSQGSSTVTFDGTPATPTSWGSGSITATVPATAASGTVAVTVEGQTANGGAFTVVPTISSLSPNYGAVGGTVTIAGSGFGLSQNGSTVTFNGTSATPTSWSAGSITVPVPAGATDGSVVVTVGGASSNGVLFTLNPIITSLGPSTGTSGTAVTILGSNFSANQGTVTFNGTAASISSWSNGSITAVVPNGASSGNVIVSNGGVLSNGVPFTVGPIVYANERTITLNHTKVPNTDQANFPVLIAGTYSFLATTANGGKVQSPNGWDIIFSSDAAGNNKLDHEIESYDPATGTINFWVRVPLLSHLADTVIYVQYGSGSVLTSQENKTGVWDSNYQMVLHMGEAAAPYHDSTSNEYMGANGALGPPAQAAGKIGEGQSFGGYIAFSQSPSPAGAITLEAWVQTSESGQRGVLGKWGNDGSSNGDEAYQMMYSGGFPGFNFNSTDGTSVNLSNNTTINDGNWHHVVAAAPATGNAFIYTDGVQTASVSNTHPLLATTSDRFLVGASGLDTLSFPVMTGSLDEVRISSSARSGDWVATEYNNQNSPSTFGSAGQENAPSIASVNPPSGEPGASITIQGSGFTGTTGTVTFNGQSAAISSWSSSSITAVIPLTATSGPVVVTAGGVQTNAVGFTVLLPTITSLSPTSGDPGTAVVIQGANFDAAQGSGQVTFNGLTASVVSWSASSITAYVPVGASTGNVVVTAPNGVASNGVSFNVTDNLGITLLSPANGPVGTAVTIFGGGFGSTQGSSTLAFNGTTATVTSWSEDEIVATVPAGTSTGPVTVTLGGGSMAWSAVPFVLSTSVQVTDSLGNNSSYTSAMLGGAWQNIAATGSGCSSCTVRGNVQDSYDGSGNVLTHTDELGHVTTYTYDAANNVISASTQLNTTTTVTTSYTYNSFGEVLTMTDPLGNVTTNTYDANGNLLSVTSPAPNGNTAASVTQFAYNSLGELTQITDPLSNVSKLAYTPTGLISTITDAQQNVTTYQYDSRGNRTVVIDALSKTTSFAYDAMDRLTTITYPDTSTASFGYDSRGRRTTVTDQNGKVTTYAYDDADRLTSVTDAANNVTQYGYDSENNLLSITDAAGHVTSFAYDAFGRVIQTKFPSTFLETYTYDAAGNLTSKDDRKGQSILYVYDALNRLTHKGYPDSTGVDYVYDLAGKIKQVTDPTGTYGMAYDNMGRLIGTTTQYAFLPGTTFTNAYGYDADSNRTSFTAPDGSTNTYQYDTLNRMNKLTSSLAGQFTFNYDVLGRRTSLGRPNGVATNYSYDSLSRLLSVLHQNGTTTVDGATYTYDNAGNRTAKTNQLNSVAEQYAYDAIYQLQQVTQGTTTTESYTYDPVGNRLSSVSVPSYNYNSSNELTSTSAVSYTYDKNGNMLTKALSSGTTQYTWDFENRLSSVVLAGTGGTVAFKYDPFGRRIQKAFTQGSTTTTTNYVYDGANSVEEVDQNAAVLARYTQGAGIDEPLAQVRSGTTSYYDQDGLGSVTSLSSSTGSLVSTYVYDTFGNLTTSSGGVTNPFQYTGRDYDPETGLRYYRARYYDSSAGRFLSEDPLEFGGEDVNFYGYVLNSPTEFVDPEGLQHTPGGPEHPAPGVKFRCKGGPNRTQDDSCDELQRKMVLIGTLLAGHALWDMAHGGHRHQSDIDNLSGAFKRCLELFNKFCVNCPPKDPPGQNPTTQPPTSPTPTKPDPGLPEPWWHFKWIPVIPRIPGGPPVFINPCVLKPTLPGCLFDPGKKTAA